MTTNNPVAEPDGVVEAPERVWFYRLHDGTWIPAWNRTAPSDIEYIRAPTPDSIAEKARRVVEMFDEWLVTGFESTLTADKVDALQRIITTEFGTGGEQGENNH